MATSTEATVRDAIAAAIRGIAGELGFARVGGNVRDYPLEYEGADDRLEYLMAEVGEGWHVRCWSVFVTASDRWHAAGGVMLREYSVVISAYYEVGTAMLIEEGVAGANLLVDHARKVRGAIRQLGSTLGGRVDTMGPMSEIAISVLSGVAPDDGRIMVGTFGFTAERRNPDF